MNEERNAKARPYRMLRRAELVEETRQRIVEAAVKLHATVGPARTTISALAEEAGVTRVTVYRHFADDDELFAACRSHWLSLHPPPDPLRWQEIPAGEDRVRQALQEQYAWYRQNRDALFLLRRDLASTPEFVQESNRAAERQAVDALLFGVHARGRARQRLYAAAGHVLSFWTWRSLAVDQSLPDREAVELATRFITSGSP